MARHPRAGTLPVVDLGLYFFWAHRLSPRGTDLFLAFWVDILSFTHCHAHGRDHEHRRFQPDDPTQLSGVPVVLSPLPYIQTLDVLRPQGPSHLQFRKHSILPFTQFPARGSFISDRYQIFAFSNFALSSLLIILRMYVFYASSYSIFRIPEEALMARPDRIAIWNWKKVIVGIAATVWVVSVSFLVLGK